MAEIEHRVEALRERREDGDDGLMQVSDSTVADARVAVQRAVELADEARDHSAAARRRAASAHDRLANAGIDAEHHRRAAQADRDAAEADSE